jgi:hypothetical protein
MSRVLGIVIGSVLALAFCACGGGTSEFDVEMNVAAYLSGQGYDSQAAGVLCDRSSFADGAETVWICWHSDGGGKGAFVGCFLPNGTPSTVESC